MNASAPPFRHEFSAMTTRCELQFFGVTPEQGRDVARRIEARVAALVQRYNFHAPDSWLNRCINERRSNAVQIDAELAEVLTVVHAHSARTHGAFDITVGTYAAALRRAKSTRDVAAVRQRLAPYTGLDCWALEGRDACVLRFNSAYTRFDLGGVIKEHAVDVSAGIARDAGVAAGLVNFGGDLFAFGRKPDQQRFVAAIPNPQSPQQMMFGLDLEDQALTTSAHYARRRPIQGGELSHVLGADLSNSAGTRWISASVVSRSALLSGIYSTALLIKDAIELPPDVHTVTVDRHHTLHRLPAAAL